MLSKNAIKEKARNILLKSVALNQELIKKECEDVKEANYLYISAFLMLIGCNEGCKVIDNALYITIDDIPYTVRLDTLKSFLRDDYEHIINEINIQNGIIINSDENTTENVEQPEQIEEDIIEQIEEDIISEEECFAEKEEPVICEPEIEEKKEEIQPLITSSTAPQMDRINYKTQEAGAPFAKSNFVFNLHHIVCKLQNGTLNNDCYDIFIYPLEYAPEGSAVRILVAILSEDDRIHCAISQKGRKNVILEMDDYKFIFSGKWGNGTFETAIYPYNADSNSFEITSNITEKINEGIFMEQFGVAGPDKNIKYHFFPLSLKNNEKKGICPFLALGDLKEDVIISDKKIELSLITPGKLNVYHSYWTGDLFNIERVS